MSDENLGFDCKFPTECPQCKSPNIEVTNGLHWLADGASFGFSGERVWVCSSCKYIFTQDPMLFYDSSEVS